MEYNRIICGGTFDRLHEGHKAFLRFAFSHGQHVLIGITSDAYVKAYKPGQQILPFSQRKQAVKDFLQENHFLDRATLVAIDSKYDQTQIAEESSQALLVSQETYTSGVAINKEREKHHLAPLPLLIFPIVSDEKGEKISSTHIRQNMQADSMWVQHVLTVPSTLREVLHKPFGLLIQGEIPQEYIADRTKVAVVGDATAKRFLAEGILPKIAVIDFFIERKATHETLAQMGFTDAEKIFTVSNPPGTLQPAVWDILSQAIATKEHTVVEVAGEEDLLVIPLILLLPVGFSLFYGQPKEGVVFLRITNELKEQTGNLMKQFSHN